MARNAIIQVRHATEANWSLSTLILASGEIAFATDTRSFKVGDGTKTWTELPFSPNTELPDPLVVNSLSVNSVSFNTDANVTLTTEGQLAWDIDYGTIDLRMADNVIQHIGQEVFYQVQADEALTKGDLVMAVGTLGASGVIKVAKARTSYGLLTNIQSQRLMGLAASNIANGERGYILHFGKLRKINTSQWQEGDILYADPSTPGGLTATQPAAPNWKTLIALVVTDHANNGELFVRPTFGSQLSNDESVTLTNPQEGQALIYNSSGVWVNGNINVSDTADAILAGQVFK